MAMALTPQARRKEATKKVLKELGKKNSITATFLFLIIFGGFVLTIFQMVFILLQMNKY